MQTEMSDAILVMTNLPDGDSAETLAAALVDAGHAACVNILPAVKSVYRWQDATERATETMLLIKTLQGRYGALEAAIRAAHPYEVPEIIAIPITAGLPEYLGWIAQETK